MDIFPIFVNFNTLITRNPTGKHSRNSLPITARLTCYITTSLLGEVAVANLVT